VDQHLFVVGNPKAKPQRLVIFLSSELQPNDSTTYDVQFEHPTSRNRGKSQTKLYWSFFERCSNPFKFRSGNPYVYVNFKEMSRRSLGEICRAITEAQRARADTGLIILQFVTTCEIDLELLSAWSVAQSLALFIRQIYTGSQKMESDDRNDMRQNIEYRPKD
jgi:hypothetical protein